MITEECGTCKYFHPEREGTDTGVCRRFPAVPLSFGLQPSALQVGGRTTAVPAVLTYFPAMQSSGWCGEWKQNERIQ